MISPRCCLAKYDAQPRQRRCRQAKPVRAAAKTAHEQELADIREKVRLAKQACFAETNERCDAAWEITEHVLVTLAKVYAERSAL
jgi:hypothetical protein